MSEKQFLLDTETGFVHGYTEALAKRTARFKEISKKEADAAKKEFSEKQKQAAAEKSRPDLREKVQKTLSQQRRERTIAARAAKDAENRVAKTSDRAGDAPQKKAAKKSAKKK